MTARSAIPPPGYVAYVDEVRAAVRLIWDETAKRREGHDAMTLMFLGGPLALSDDDFVGALLELVNRPTLEDLRAREAQRLITPDGIPDERLLWNRERAKIGRNLESIITSEQSGETFRREQWARKLRPRIVSVPAIVGSTGITLVTDGDAARSYAFFLLTDPDRSYKSQLRRCELKSCKKFFLDADTRPGQRRRYCKNSVCSSVAEKLAARKRAQDWRKEQKPNPTRRSQG